MDGVKLQIEGLKELNQILTQLPDKLQTNVRKGVNFKAANIVVNEMRNSAPLGNNLSKKAREKLKNNIVAKGGKGDSVIVGVGKKAFWGVFLSSGTKDRETKKNYSRGKITGTGWITSAHERAIPQVIDFLNTNYLQIVNQTIEKFLRRFSK